MGSTGQRRHEGRWRRAAGVSLVVVAVSAMVLVGLGPSPASASGTAELRYSPGGPWRIVYGQDLRIQGIVEDYSNSCISIVRDCDNPGGQVYLSTAGPDGFPIAVGDLSPLGEEPSLSSFSMTMRGKQLAPGHYDVVIGYSGDFDAVFYDSTLDVVKNPCRMVVTQSSPSSRPGDTVTFTAALTDSAFAHPGATITFTDGVGGFLASGTVDAADRVSFATAGLPQGDNVIVASYGGTAIDDACTGYAVHQVAIDPAPVAVDDSYSTEAGAPITVRPMDNDFDPGGGAIRIEYLTSPDAGDAEAIDDTSLLFTPPDDGIGETSMSYVVYDSVGQSSNEGTIRFTWGCTPEADDDAYEVAYGQALVVEAPGVTGNDATCDLPTEVVSGPAHGSLTYDTQLGGFSYTPVAGHIGPDSFTYRYSQGLDSPVDARVDLLVNVPPPSTTTTTTTTASTSTTSTVPTTTTTASTSTTSTVPTTTSTTPSTTSSTSSSTTSTSTVPTTTSTTSPTSSTAPTTTSTSSTSSTTVVDPTTSTSTPAPTTSTTTGPAVAGGSGTAPGPGGGVAGGGTAPPAALPSTLPYTGADTTGPLLTGLALTAGGGAAVLASRRLRR